MMGRFTRSFLGAAAIALVAGAAPLLAADAAGGPEQGAPRRRS